MEKSIQEDSIMIRWCWGQKPPTMMPTDCFVLRTPTILPAIRISWCLRPTFMLISGRVSRSFYHQCASTRGFRPFAPDIIWIIANKKIKYNRVLFFGWILFKPTFSGKKYEGRIWTWECIQINHQSWFLWYVPLNWQVLFLAFFRMEV